MSAIPVCCTAKVIESLLDQSRHHHNRIVPNSPRSFVVITHVEDKKALIPDHPPPPSLRPFSTPFLAKSADEVAEYLPTARYFVILDDRSSTDGTVLLAKKDRQNMRNPLQTVRAAFEVAQLQLVALEVGCGDFIELQNAVSKIGGGYRAAPQAQRGGAAPPKPSKHCS
ncbi:hypothetical protein S40285_10229 [Stachybotrys chlorohalonatus IBT 40285]|uniref:Uncharacterized protein n=1 Tax=Stachybotrys chlorohalonatus (strain IBT 40285) TaxID=1283841 RepID=A0A084QZT8_STAC4|nr:hypothetical protein S40285_10229 [Stachybotrys chlorohalonata IBT 40285]